MEVETVAKTCSSVTFIGNVWLHGRKNGSGCTAVGAPNGKHFDKSATRSHAPFLGPEPRNQLHPQPKQRHGTVSLNTQNYVQGLSDPYPERGGRTEGHHTHQDGRERGQQIVGNAFTEFWFKKSFEFKF